jgi:hypothetical protein
VARIAEEAYERFTPEQRETARSILLRLASAEGDVATRRRAPLAELELDTNEDARRVVRVLTESRLVTVSEEALEVAHEALLREWPRLREWLEEDAEGRRLHGHVIRAAREWDDAGRDPAELYRGARLAAALDWAAEHDTELNELERSFLAESQAASEAEDRRIRRTNRRLRLLLAGAVVFLVAALAAGGLAFVQSREAQRESDRAGRAARVAQAREWAARALANANRDEEGSILTAIEAVEITHEDGIVVEEASDALSVALGVTLLDSLNYQAGAGIPGADAFAFDTLRLVELARDRVKRSMTPEECQFYLRMPACPRRRPQLPDVTVPGVMGSDMDSARSTLEAAGFRVSVRTFPTNDPDKGDGTVIFQQATGVKAERGSIVEIGVWRYSGP